MAVEQYLVGDQRPIIRISHQKSEQQVLLVPRPIAREDPVLWIFMWQKDVMKMQGKSRRQPRYDLEQDVVDVGSDLTDMAGIDEQQVAGGKRCEELERHILHTLAVEAGKIANDF